LPRQRRVPALDGIRALAVLLVFCYHAGSIRFQGGWLGVDVFFVLSGYLITALLLNEHADKGTVSLRAFYMRRALRLVPALVVMVALLTPVNLWAEGGHIGDSLPPLFYFSNFWAIGHPNGVLFIHTWSLSIEEQFYLLWPVCLVLCLRYRKLRVLALAGAIILSAASLKMGLSHLGPPGIYYLPTTYLPVLGAGAAVAIYLHRRSLPWQVGAYWRRGSVAIAALGRLIALALTAPRGEASSFYGPVPLTAICSVALILHVSAAPDGPVARLLSVRPLTWLGKRSYAFYLWHTAFASFLLSRGTAPIVNAAITGPLALLVTAASWRYVERPFQQIKDRRFRSSGLAMAEPGPRVGAGTS
jgi:peptidoglycan/LPS O-acetylase OafA/YrhL